MLPATSDRLDAVFSALADPTRRAILARLASDKVSVTEVAQPFDMNLPAISKHFKVLERAGLITRSRNAQWRPCRLDPAPLKAVTDYVEEYRRTWEERFDRLEGYLANYKARNHRARRRWISPENSPAKTASDRDIVQIRVFNAPERCPTRLWTRSA